MSDTGSYVYLATRSLNPESLRELTGINGAETRVVQCGDLAAVVSTVDLAEFGEDALKRNLENLEWLEQVARTHDRVIDSVNQIATVAPLRMVTIVYDDDRVAQLLDEWGADLMSTLDRVQGSYEWSVKAFQETGGPPSEGGGGQAESGTAYLKRRRAETEEKAKSAEAATEQADALHRTLSERTVASRQLPAQDRRLTGHVGEMTLNGAYLVEESRGGEFEQLVEELAERHAPMRLEVNGPWPPYSFATLETGGGA